MVAGVTHLNRHRGKQEAMATSQADQFDHQAGSLRVTTHTCEGGWKSSRSQPLDRHTGGTRLSGRAVSIHADLNRTDLPAYARAPCSPYTTRRHNGISFAI